MFSKIGGLIKVIGILVIVLELSMLLCRKKEDEFEELFATPSGFEYKA